MQEIQQRYPHLSFEWVRVLAHHIVEERNAVAAVNQVFADSGWGLACLACQVVRKKVEALARDSTYPWLRYVAEKGMAYTVLLDGVPLRIQPDVEEIRDVMSAERSAMNAQMSLFGDEAETILRLEVSQRPGQAVDLVTLFLFREKTAETLDSFVVYDVNGASGRPSGQPGVVIPLARPAEEADISDLFAFPSEDQALNDNDYE